MLDIPYRVVAKLLTKIFDKPLTPPSSSELELVDELRNRFQDLSHPQGEDMPPSQAEWAGNMIRLRELVLNDNPRRFLRWDVVRASMFVTHPRYIQRELSFLRRQPIGTADWNSRWRQAIEESQQGHPLPYPFYPRSSGNLIHHAYHLAQFEQRMHVPVQDMECVIEFGGGYGSMCRLFHRLGFKGTYIIFDLPPFSALQKFFLKSVGISVQETHPLASRPNGVICMSDFADLKVVLSEHVHKKNSMFISIWAISETPMHTRDSFLPLIAMVDFFLIAYAYCFGEMDNIRYFTGWQKRFENQVIWQNWEIEHLPGSSYLIGGRLRADGRS
jgi:hypothetical protein